MSSGRMSHVGPGPRMGKVTKKDTYGGDGNNEDGIKSSEGETELPLEKRFVDFKSDSGVVTKLAALHKKWTQGIDSSKLVDFYLPDTYELGKEESEVKTWVQYMEVLISDLKYFLSLPHHEFWSVMVHVKEIPQDILYSFRIKAPRFYDPTYLIYETHELIWPIYKTIYVLVFRIYMRLATFKESPDNYISPAVWSDLLHENELINMRTIMDLSTLYESKDNPLFQKMVKYLMENNPRLVDELQDYIPLLMSKFSDLCGTIESLISQNNVSKEWDIEKLEQLLSFQLDTVYSLYKLLKVFPQVAENFLRHPNFVNGFAMSYETNTKLWGKVVAHLQSMEERVNLCRAGMLRLFRAVVANPTILSVESANDRRLDEFFDYFSSCIDEKVFIHDYEKAFPFRSDMQALLSRGIFVDETRIDYMANAISSCFYACGEEYSVEKIVVDPLYDPNFDRQLLGACSLEITGVELDSLITQVKDLLPELPNSYIEAVLKHYGYSAETTINALLEGSVPSRLEKYKNEEYIKSQSSVSTPGELEDPVQDKLPVHLTDNENVVLEKETFIPGKKDKTGFRRKELTMMEKNEVESFLSTDKNEVKTAALTALQNFVDSVKTGPVPARRPEEDDNIRNSYIDAALLPTFNEAVEYDDEYDDTYDDLGAGMTEPDNNLFNPLNRKKVELVNNGKDSSPADDEDEEEPTSDKPNRNFDAFCEDPSVVRERFERRRQDMQSRGGGGRHHQQQQNPQPIQRDVVGNAKGQGQEKEVVYNRRQKTANKGAGGSWKKRSDFKRKEF